MHKSPCMFYRCANVAGGHLFRVLGQLADARAAVHRRDLDLQHLRRPSPAVARTVSRTGPNRARDGTRAPRATRGRNGENGAVSTAESPARGPTKSNLLSQILLCQSPSISEKSILCESANHCFGFHVTSESFARGPTVRDRRPSPTPGLGNRAVDTRPHTHT